MPASSAGVAEVVGQIRAIQRRLNTFTVQHAVYLTATVGVLAASIIVATALRGQSLLFGIAFWAALGAVAVAAVHAALRIRRNWLTIEQTARLADRRAGLADRLATLLTVSSGRRDSRLQPMLLAQVLAASPRWDAQALSRRRVPRSVFALLAALAVLIATSFYARPPREPDAQTAAARRDSGADEVLVPQPGGKAAGAVAAVVAPLAASEQSAASGSDPSAHGSATTAPSGTGAGDGPGGGERGGESLGNGAGDGGVGESPTGHGGVNERMQQAIRDALGAGDRDRGGASPSTSPDGDRQRRDGGAAQQPQSPEPAQDDGPARHDSPPERASASPPERETGTGRSAPSAGSGSAGSAGGLFAGQASVNRAKAGTQSLSIKLGAQTALAPSQHEPQRQPPPVGALAAASAPENGQPHALADEQLPVAALQKADVAAEHEAIVRRIFTRDE